MLVKCIYFDGKASRGEQAEIHLDENGVLQLTVHEYHAAISLGDVQISRRLGNTPRVFEFPDGGRAETTDNDTVDRMLRYNSPRSGWLHRLEASQQIGLIAVVTLILLAWSSIQYLVPWTAERLARAIPQEAGRSISEQALKALDKALLEPSKLTEARRKELRAGFNGLVESVAGDHQFELKFRSGKSIGPNAFALPSGVIVLLDELVAVAENDDELLAILAHEIGHVVGRHSLRSVLQDSAVVLVISAIVGDVLSTSSLASALPVLLVESKYSREFELESDQFALDLMHVRGIPLRAFPDLLQRISSKNEMRGDVPSFFSSHPGTEERVKMFQDD